MPPPAAGDSPRGSRSMARCVPRARPPGLGGRQSTAGGLGCWGSQTARLHFGAGGGAGWGWGGKKPGAEKEQPENRKGEKAGRGGRRQNRTEKARSAPKIARARPGWGRQGPEQRERPGGGAVRSPPPSRSPPSLSFSFAFFFFSLPPFKRQTPCREIRISRGKCRALIGCGCRSPASRQPAAPGGGGP